MLYFLFSPNDGSGKDQVATAVFGLRVTDIDNGILRPILLQAVNFYD
jgi:hypothetical protein